MSNDNRYFLDSNVNLEPLILNWYAWPFLVSPQTHGAFIRKQIKSLESFLSAPSIHEEATSSDSFTGGAFVDLKVKDTGKVENLIERMRSEGSLLMQFSDDCQLMSRTLQAQANGGSLDQLYQSLPNSLKGLCELVYDENNSPKLRIFESLAYETYLRSDWQSVCLTKSGEVRKFSLSAPRFESDDNMLLPVKLSSPIIDMIAKARTQAVDLGKIIAELNLSPGEAKKFHTFFTPDSQSPRAIKKPLESGLKIKYFGHACVLIETPNQNILIDPVVKMYKGSDNSNTFTIWDLPDTIHQVLITHNHHDHIMFETLLQIRSRVGEVVIPRNNSGSITDPSMKLILNQLGFYNVTETTELERLCRAGTEITTLPFLGEHGDLNIHTKQGYHIKVGEFTAAFLADSNNLDPKLYYRLRNKFGSLDYLFIGMECVGAPMSWVYGHLLPEKICKKDDQSRRLNGSNAEKAVDVIKAWEPKSVNIYAMGLEKWMSHILGINDEISSPAIIESEKVIEYGKSHSFEVIRLYGKEEWVIDSVALPC